MEGVRCISSGLVQAATHKVENQRVELTPWDLHFLLVNPIQKGLLFPKPKPSGVKETNENSFINHLKTSLSHTLDYFTPLAGRLATTEHDHDTISFFIDCNNAGALFVHAEADGVTISDIVKPVYVPSIVSSFFTLNGMKNCEGIFKPLLGVQVTELVDGVFVGVTINHSVADGTSFWHFLIHGQKFQEQSHEELILPPLRDRVFHFSKQSIAELKAKANAEAGVNNISSLQALLSHFWQSSLRSKKLDPNEEMSYYMLIGARPRLHKLPEEYFGNAVKSGTITLKAKALQEQSVGNIAREMNRMIATQTEEEFTKNLESWIANPQLIESTKVLSNIMITGSSPRFNIYGNDFGWGRPITVRCGSTNIVDGKINLFCGVEEGSIDIQACLSVETLETMANDQEFMSTVTI
ncbi:hypothetical protein PTKIN_Ptkin07bG0271600 [Pterospermum kingtungense]